MGCILVLENEIIVVVSVFFFNYIKIMYFLFLKNYFYINTLKII
jgi:hypothetical protein